MGEKNRYNKAYDEGYKKGKHAGAMDAFSHRLGKILPPSETEDSYDAGFSDGQRDKYDDNDSHYNGGTSESSDCFITTATLLSIGKPDDCEELNVFRNFRDKWLVEQPDGKVLISDYYIIAPEIVKAIDERSNHIRIYSDLWKDILEPCLGLIKNKKYEQAKAIYCSTVQGLKSKYL